MNKKLLSVVMSGAMIASACSTGVSAAETGFKDRVVNFVKNHKSIVIGGAVTGAAAIGGTIAWLVYHNRDIKLDCKDKDFRPKLLIALKAFKNSLTIINVEKSDMDKIDKSLAKALKLINKKLKKNMKAKWDTEDIIGDSALDDTTKGVIVITKEVQDNKVILKSEFKVDAKKDEEKKEEEEEENSETEEEEDDLETEEEEENSETEEEEDESESESEPATEPATE